MLQQALAGIFKEFEGELEVARVAIIGIRNGLLPWMMAQIVAHTDNLPLVILIAGLARNIVIVLVIHHSDEIETVEVLCRELTGMMVESIAMTLSATTHTKIRQLSDMPGADASRVDIKTIVEPSLSDKMLHDTICCRGAADVT